MIQKPQKQGMAEKTDLERRQEVWKEVKAISVYK